MSSPHTTSPRRPLSLLARYVRQRRWWPGAASADMTDRKRRDAILEEVESFAEAIVETVREPLLVLDKDLHVKMANQSFLRTFRASKGETERHLLYELGNHQWDIPDLR